MATIVLHRYYNDAALSLESGDIKSTKRFSAEDDAQWPEHIDAKPYTLVELKDGARTSEGAGNAYVKETPEQIKAMCPA